MTDTTTGWKRNWWVVALWAAQILLALAYAGAGYMKVSQPIDSLAAAGMSYTLDFPELLTRFIGTVEILGALGLILPAITRVLPWLTPLAALGFSVIQVLAIILHATRGETAMTLPVNLVLLALSLFVLWGRWRKAPIAPRRAAAL